jgi:hypothetical protein
VDVIYFFRGQTFIWDAHKAIANRAKHNVSFQEACEIFFDPSQESEDASMEGEYRLAIIGMTVREELLYVVHIEREAERIRIISARRATARERNLYEDRC